VTPPDTTGWHPVHIVKRVTFCAAHWYRRPDWTDAQNEARFYACANPHGHGHNYGLAVSLSGLCDPATGMLANLTDVKHWLHTHVVSVLDHKNLNAQIPQFSQTIPTLENLGRFIWQQLMPTVHQLALPHQQLKLVQCRLTENETLFMTCYHPIKEGDTPVLTLTRRYHFSAAHRLFNPAFSDEKNEAIFGLCNNPNGHGHNYEIELTLTGTPDPDTGMLVDIVALDTLVQTHLLALVDHKHLNMDVPFLAHVIPTAENLAVAFWQQLQPPIACLPGNPVLHQLRVIESKNNYADYWGTGAVVSGLA
jgi:6-pyruvoyltetrahydropterin/6-carboxytetrahydropterin synthase